MENNNSNNGGSLITRLIKSLVVIIIMGVFFGLFLYEPRREIKDENKENNDVIKTNVEILEIVNEEVLKLYDTISYADGYYCGVNIYYTNDKVTTKDIDNKLAFSMALSAMNRDGKNSIDNQVNIKADDMEKKIKSILGKDYEYKHDTYSICPSYPYNDELKEYEFKGAQCGGTCGPSILKKIVKAVRTGDYLDIYVRVLFDKYDTELKYYSDYDRTKLINDIKKDYYGEYYFEDKDYSKGSLYKLRFKKEDNNMIFDSSELVKN